MNFRLFERDWLVLPSVYHAMADTHFRLLAADEKSRDGVGFEGNFLSESDAPGGVKIIAWNGVMMHNPAPYEAKYYGAVDTQKIRAAIERAKGEAAAIVLAIDSPGGEATGVEELAESIAKAPIPVLAHTNGIMASAAYFAGSQALSVYASPSACVGSIGVYKTVFDVSEFYQKMGVKVELFASGKYKTAGVEGGKLTDEQRANFQESINSIHGIFKSAVKFRRSNVRDEDMEGQVFSGREAAARGLVTGLETSLDAVVLRAAKMAN